MFDPMRNGRVIGGPAPNPLLQLRVEVRGNDIFVSR
jgi:Rieske Fe-S protein